ncbi:hypothetical protein [Isoptericola halotolerans]|uniref:2-C-methyl-D-erythritol 4-phosphate cytidylyltransferase n=1 Tax=Isoptericola halotolerans TaxID=300560 RepID=A0ABX2A744_9MICO|nr:hypothetical protein [Isoptericola halotolerans]NOV97592.1 2-C-methyl-D-erythritol 4-phosphate cytidylyltransferase [Isoptericola halotolerans]
MSAATRRRIHLTETARLAAIIDRNAMAGEPRAATVARLVEKADLLSARDEDFLVFDPDRPTITTEQVADLLDEDDVDAVAETRRG